MTVTEMIYDELKSFREETNERLKSIETEVKRTNGRVTDLERPDPAKPIDAITVVKAPTKAERDEKRGQEDRKVEVRSLLIKTPMFWVWAIISTISMVTSLSLLGMMPTIANRLMTHWGF